MMPSGTLGSTETPRRASYISQLLGQETGSPGVSSNEPNSPNQAALAIPQRKDGSPSRNSFSSSLTKRTPVRSFFHRTVADGQRKVPSPLTHRPQTHNSQLHPITLHNMPPRESARIPLNLPHRPYPTSHPTGMGNLRHGVVPHAHGQRLILI